MFCKFGDVFQKEYTNNLWKKNFFSQNCTGITPLKTKSCKYSLKIAVLDQTSIKFIQRLKLPENENSFTYPVQKLFLDHQQKFFLLFIIFLYLNFTKMEVK